MYNEFLFFYKKEPYKQFICSSTASSGSLWISTIFSIICNGSIVRTNFCFIYC